MMSNWLCIHLVDNSLKTQVKHLTFNDRNNQGATKTDLECGIVADKHTPTRKGKIGTIPGPVSAPPTPKRRSYWSWHLCTKCDLNAPPRCHHCPFCDNCVLKRDHHCFFTRRCVGFYNQRHFVVFLVWAVFGTVYTTAHFIPYLLHVFLVSAWDLFAPFALLRACFGYGDFTTANIMFIFTFNLLFVMLSSAFLFEQIDLINTGITQFEQKKVDTKRLVISDPRHINDKVKAVLGYNYASSFVIPIMHLVYPPHENPFQWPEHKIYKK
jgi:palmitoyltransferase